MPTYQYACTSCGEQLEAVQKFSDDPLAECPACGGRLRKVFSAVGVVFKGSGFYKTDSRSSGNNKKKDDKPESTKKSDDKPAGTASEKSSSPDKSNSEKSSPDKSSPEKSSSDKPPASSS